MIDETHVPVKIQEIPAVAKLTQLSFLDYVSRELRSINIIICAGRTISQDLDTRKMHLEEWESLLRGRKQSTNYSK